MNKTHPSMLIAGLKGAGKTALIKACLAVGNSKGKSYAAFKPFDKGIMEKNATEAPTDAEIYCQIMAHEPMSTLITPYIAHENYPIEMAFRRDGIRVDFKLVQSRLQVLNSTYDHTLIELPSGLLTPITEEVNTLEWAKQQKMPLLYLLAPRQEEFAAQLAELEVLKHSGIEFFFAMNNALPPQDSDYIFYLWETLEKRMGLQAEGMFPYLEGLNAADLAEALHQHLPLIAARLV